VRRVLLVAAFVILVLADCAGVSALVFFGALGLAFALVGRGGIWLPVILILVPVDAGLIWLTVAVVRRLRS
jgi:hypothetical protein